MLALSRRQSARAATVALTRFALVAGHYADHEVRLPYEGEELARAGIVLSGRQ